jgi:hypothetical protein
VIDANEAEEDELPGRTDAEEFDDLTIELHFAVA